MGIKAKVAIEADTVPPFPKPLGYLWAYFIEIAMGLPVNGMAISVVTWEALSSWSQLRRMSLDPWEASALVRLGQLRSSVLSEKSEGGTKPNAD